MLKNTVSDNKNTEFKVLLQPETKFLNLVSGFSSLTPLSIWMNSTLETNALN